MTVVPPHVSRTTCASLLHEIQIEPMPSGNLPHGFDPSTCRSVYVGNVHAQVTEPLLHEVFASTGPVEGCKLVRKEKSSFGFIHYFDRRSASLAIFTLNGRHLFGQPIKVNWAYASGQREDTSSHYNIFVGDLSAEVTDAMLCACFSVYPSCSLLTVHIYCRVFLYIRGFDNGVQTVGKNMTFIVVKREQEEKGFWFGFGQEK